MTAGIKKLRDELVKKLTPSQRIELAEALIVSVGDFVSKEVEAAWDKEIGRRLDEHEAGRVKTIPSKKSTRGYKAPFEKDPSRKNESVGICGINVLLRSFVYDCDSKENAGRAGQEIDT